MNAVSNHVDGQILETEKDKYRIGRRLGSGGIGVVYSATRLSDGTRVAVKLLHSTRFELTDTVYERFKREATLGQLTDHPNLLHVLAAASRTKARDYDFIVMEYLAGPLLSSRVDRLETQERRRIAGGLVDGLEELHSMGLIHRDLKSNNVVLVQDRGPVICDYGLLKLAEEDVHITDSTDKLGSLLYASSEQIRAPASVDHRDDIYALMACFFEIFAGERMSIRWYRNPIAYAPALLRDTIQNILLERWERDEWPDLAEIRSLLSEEVSVDASSALEAANAYPANVDMFVAWHLVCEKVREIVTAEGGSWAGSSLHGIDIYLEFAAEQKLIDSETLEEIKALEGAVDAGLGGRTVHRGEASEAWEMGRYILKKLQPT